MKRISCKWLFAMLSLLFLVLIGFGVFLLVQKPSTEKDFFMFVISKNYFLALLCIVLAGFFLISGVFVLLLMPPECERKRLTNNKESDSKRG